MHQVVGEPLHYHQDEDGDYYTPERLAVWLETKFARHGEPQAKYAAEMIRWFANARTWPHGFVDHKWSP